MSNKKRYQLGDPLYGPRSTPEWLDGTTLMLHSRLLALRLPGAEEFSEFRAPVPERFTRVLDLLRGHYEKCQLP
jgi:23S rRNA pseudouridine1911/1915/1917 synthase